MSKSDALALTHAITRLAVAVETMPRLAAAVETLNGLIIDELTREHQKEATRTAEIAHKTAKALEPK